MMSNLLQGDATKSVKMESKDDFDKLKSGNTLLGPSKPTRRNSQDLHDGGLTAKATPGNEAKELKKYKTKVHKDLKKKSTMMHNEEMDRIKTDNMNNDNNNIVDENKTNQKRKITTNFDDDQKKIEIDSFEEQISLEEGDNIQTEREMNTARNLVR